MSKLNEMITEYCPNGVEYKPLHELMDFRNGKGHEKNICEGGKYIVVNSRFISTDGAIVKLSNEQICPLYKDEILMVMSDLPNGRALAKCYIVDEDDKYTLNQRICALKIKPSVKASVKFLFYVLNRNSQLLAYNNGIDQTNLKKQNILDVSIPFPSLEIQNEIVRVLDSFTSLMGELTSNITAELKARKKQYSYYRDELLKPQENIPIVTLKEIATSIYRGSGIKRDQVTDEGIPCVRYGEIYTTYNTWFDECVSHTRCLL